MFQFDGYRPSGTFGKCNTARKEQASGEKLMDDELQFDIETDVEGQMCSVIPAQLEHILVIDDDNTQTEILSHLLSKQGYRVSTAATCEEGFAKAQSEMIDLILLDIGMPDGDGLQMCSAFSDGATTSEIPVIIVSGLEKPSVVRQARAAGCQYYVRKPYDPNALLLLVQNAIGESKNWDLEG